MYDFNPLSTLFLLKALPTDVRLPSLRGLIRGMKARLTRPTFQAPPAIKTEASERAFACPVHGSHPSYNVSVQADVPAR